MEPIELFTILNVTVCAHQALLAAAVPLCLWLGVLGARRAGLPARATLWFAPLGVLLGLFFAHLGFCLLRLGDVLNYYGAGYLWRFWEGDGLHAYMLYGGLLGCALAAWLAARLAGVSALKLMDALAPAGALMMAFCRAAQGLAGQGHGRELAEGSRFAFFPFAVFDPWGEIWCWAVFVPAALYLAGVALALGRGARREARPGDATLRLLLLYAGAQITFESLRMDDVLRWGFVRCSQVLSAVTVAFVLACYARAALERAADRRARARRLAVGWAAYIALLSVCLLMEFAIEKRVAFLEFLEPAGCHAVMSAASAAMIVIGYRARRLAGER